MAGPLADLLTRRRLRKVREHFATAADQAATLDPFALRALMAEARSLRRPVDRAIHAAEARLAVPALGASLPRQPLGTDWAWRPDAWRGPMPDPGGIAATDRTAIGPDLALYHDCPLAEIAFRQCRGSADRHRAPFGLTVEVFGFKGTFLSLAMTLPPQATQGLKSRHLIRVDAVIDSERPVRAFARLNVRHGPNVAQLVSDLAPDGQGGPVEFDLAYAGIDESRIDRAWLDLIFNDPAMTGIHLRDVVVSRRPRAEL